MHKWQATALLGLIEENDYDAVFTHIHSCDHVGHCCWRWAKSREKYGNNDEKVYQEILEAIYLQCDEYVGMLMQLPAIYAYSPSLADFCGLAFPDSRRLNYWLPGSIHASSVTEKRRRSV